MNIIAQPIFSSGFIQFRTLAHEIILTTFRAGLSSVLFCKIILSLFFFRNTLADMLRQVLSE